jgi:hypothetical protein
MDHQRNNLMYKHSALDYSRKQIRLLRLRSAYGSSGNQLHCEITTFDLETAPTYHALSYMWGVSNPTYSISVNAGSLVIGRNLALFFQALCRGKAMCSSGTVDRPNAASYFWIDQLCIAQQNTSERNRQVAIMAQIYQRASSTVVWLQREEGIVTVPTVNRDPLAIQVLSHPYFSRLWIVQEIVLSQRVCLFLEDGIWLDWADLRALFLRNPDIQYEALFGPVSNILTAKHSRAQENDLLVYIDAFAGHGCQDPRDKIYGMLGLGQIDQSFVVDYEKSIQQILLDVLELTLPMVRNKSTVYNKNVLIRLGPQLGLTCNQQNGWINFLSHVSEKCDLSFHWEHGDPSMITAMGFDSMTSNADKTKGGLEDDLSLESWWFECEGKRHHCLCASLEALGQAPTTWHTRSQDPTTHFSPEEAYQAGFSAQRGKMVFTRAEPRIQWTSWE